jgi:hypothetical protein
VGAAVEVQPGEPVGARHRGVLPLTRQVAALDTAPSERAVRQVHDRLAEVRRERLLSPEVAEATHHLDERVLHQVLGQLMLAGQEVGEPQRIGCVLGVQRCETVAGGDARLVRCAHSKPLRARCHALETLNCSIRLRSPDGAKVRRAW